MLDANVVSCDQVDFMIEGSREVGIMAITNAVVSSYSSQRGLHDIDCEMVFKSNPKLIFHDSPGFEAGREDEFEKMKNFITERANTNFLGKQIHAIW